MFQLSQRVRFTDLDIIGHANYSVYLQLVDDTVFEWWRQDYSQETTEFGLVAVWMAATWKAAIETASAVIVSLRALDVGTTSFELYAEVTHPRGHVAFASRIRYVFTVQGRPTPLPSQMRALLVRELVPREVANTLRQTTRERAPKIADDRRTTE